MNIQPLDINIKSLMDCGEVDVTPDYRKSASTRARFKSI
jgi:hypothetical protein